MPVSMRFSVSGLRIAILRRIMKAMYQARSCRARALAGSARVMQRVLVGSTCALRSGVLDIPYSVTQGDDGVYGDVEMFVSAYIESGQALHDWLALWAQNMRDWDQWVVVNGGDSAL